MATALKIMADAGPLDPATVTPTLDWIESITAADGGVPAVLPSLAKYPHAPFMPIDAEPTGSLLATGQLLGPLLRAGIAEHPWVKGAMEFTRREVEALGQTHPYDVDAAVMFLDAAPDQGWARQQAERIGALVREQRIVLLDPARPQDAVIAPGYAPGSTTCRTTTPRRPTAWHGPGSATRRWSGAWTTCWPPRTTTADGR
ncbi:hypothetical protein ACFQ9X_19975 [Catenulispora yoronensis]